MSRHPQTSLPTLTELGLPAADLRFAGTHAYSPGAPITTSPFRDNFILQVSYGDLAMYYFHHPGLPLRLLGRGLTYFAPAMRPGNLANYQREDGFPPGTLSQHFALWSHLRAWSMFVFPAQLVILYGDHGDRRAPLDLAIHVGCPLAVVSSGPGAGDQRHGGIRFRVLLDATETARHLFFFHVITEILIVCAVALAVQPARRRACTKPMNLAELSYGPARPARAGYRLAGPFGRIPRRGRVFLHRGPH